MKNLLMFFSISFLGLSSIQGDVPSCSNTDMVIFSYDRPMQLFALLESIELYVTGFASIAVIYRTSSNAFADGYQQIKERFTYINYLHQGLLPASDFKSLTLQATFDSPSKYVLFAVDDDIVTDYVDLNRCIDLLEEYQAYAFYLRLGLQLTECYALNSSQSLPLVVQLREDIFSWRLCDGHHDWGYPNNVDFTLYRKSDIKDFFYNAYYTSPNSLEGLWANESGLIKHRYGLCCQTSKIVNIPLNLVQNEYCNRAVHYITSQQLLMLFNIGLKINIKPLYRIQNKSAHMYYEPTFVNRKQLNS